MEEKSSISHFKDEWMELIENRNSKSIEFRRREASMVAMALLGICALTVLITINWRTYPDLLLNILIINDLGLTASLIIYFKTKQLKLAGVVCIVCALLLDMMLIYSGGKEDTALYWAMFFPLAAFSVSGVRLGSFFTILMFISAITLLYSVDIVANYSPVEKSRFLMALFCVGTLSFINEYFRTREYSETRNMSLNYEKDANTDPLTHLPNRRFLESDYVNNAVQMNESFIVVLADIDNFKSVNDNYGHDVGDEALIHCANVFGQNIRKSDLLCRYGGEEFLFCLPDTSAKQAFSIAEKLRISLKKSKFVSKEGIELSLTCSFGLASLAERTFDDGIKAADKRLYKAKENGRDQVVFK